MEKVLRDKLRLSNPTHMLALGFGSGLAPQAPGTYGSLIAFPLIVPMLFMPVWGQLIYVLAACVLGVYVCGKTAKDMGVHDHGCIVWDEVAGMMITFLALPQIHSYLQLIHVFLVGFVLFRAFDITKPWPIRLADRKVHGGVGIMLDDILAGVAAWCFLHLWLNFQF